MTRENIRIKKNGIDWTTGERRMANVGVNISYGWNLAHSLALYVGSIWDCLIIMIEHLINGGAPFSLKGFLTTVKSSSFPSRLRRRLAFVSFFPLHWQRCRHAGRLIRRWIDRHAAWYRLLLYRADAYLRVLDFITLRTTSSHAIWRNALFLIHHCPFSCTHLESQCINRIALHC